MPVFRENKDAHLLAGLGAPVHFIVGWGVLFQYMFRLFVHNAHNRMFLNEKL